jgi:hypothetical protein
MLSARSLMKLSPKEQAEASRLMDLLMPLHFFYAQAGRALPPVEIVEAAQMPENERELLAHDHDMTSTLSEYHSSELGLNVIEKEESGSCLMRMVVLERLRPPRIPVEFGAIGIHLDYFKGHARQLITACEKPLGAILEDERIHYHSAPRALFRVIADSFIAGWLAEPEGVVLWGRSNVLTDSRGGVFADIVEILPRAHAPVPPSVHKDGAPRHGPPERRR